MLPAPNPGQGSIVAGTFGNTCPQGRATDSEDCLFLNVYAPTSTTARSKLPVYIWIHGARSSTAPGLTTTPR
jgi:carboxylesterase type B